MADKTYQGDDDGYATDEYQGEEEQEEYHEQSDWNRVLEAAKKDAEKSRNPFCPMISSLAFWFRSDSWVVSHDEAQKDLCMALRVNNLALDQGQRLTIMQIYREYKAKLSVGASKEDSFINVNIVAGTFSVAVPVIIPYSQTYKNYVCYGFKGCLGLIGTNSTGTGTSTNVPTGTPINVGTCLAIVGVICSLIATVLNMFQKTSKLKETSEADIQEAEDTEKELNLFLAFSGDYTVGLPNYDAEVGYYVDNVDKAYSLLIQKYQDIRTKSFDAMKASLASDPITPKSTPNPKAKGAPKKKGKGKNEKGPSAEKKDKP